MSASIVGRRSYIILMVDVMVRLARLGHSNFFVITIFVVTSKQAVHSQTFILDPVHVVVRLVLGGVNAVGRVWIVILSKLVLEAREVGH